MANYKQNTTDNAHPSITSNMAVDTKNRFHITIGKLGDLEIRFELTPNCEQSMVYKLFLALQSCKKDRVFAGGEHFEGTYEIKLGDKDFKPVFYFQDGSKEEFLKIFLVIHELIPFTEKNCDLLARILGKAKRRNTDEILGIVPIRSNPYLDVTPKDLLEVFEIIDLGTMNSKIDKLTAQNGILMAKVDALSTQMNLLIATLEKSNSTTPKSEGNTSSTPNFF